MPSDIAEYYPAYQSQFCGFFMLQTPASMLDYDNGVLWPYIGTGMNIRMGILNCPSEIGTAVRPTGPTSSGPRNFSYSFNSQMRGTGYTDPITQTLSFHRGIKIVQIVHPADKVMIVEEAWPNDTNAVVSANTVASPTSSNDQLTNHHFSGSNACFADGHAENDMPQDLGLNPTGGTTFNVTLQSQRCDLFSH